MGSLPRNSKLGRRGKGGDRPLAPISEVEEELLAVKMEGVVVDAVMEAHLLEERLPEALLTAMEDALEVRSKAAVEELHMVVAGQQAGSPSLRNHRESRPEPIGQEGTLEVTDPLPPPPSRSEENWDEDPQSAAEMLQRMREHNLGFGGVAHISPCREPVRHNIAPAGYWEDGNCREQEARAGTGRRRRRRNRGVDWNRGNFESPLFASGPFGGVRAASAESLTVVSPAVAPVPPPVLRDASGVSRTTREDDSRPSPELRLARPRRGGERQPVESLEEAAVVEAVREDPQPEPREPAHRRRCGKWLTRDGCRKRGSQFGGLVLIPRNRARDPLPHACFNCYRLGHTLKHYPEPRRSQVCFNCGRRDETMRTCDRFG